MEGLGVRKGDRKMLSLNYSLKHKQQKRGYEFEKGTWEALEKGKKKKMM